MSASPSVLLICGVPGAGKSTFCDWLVESLGYHRVDVDTNSDPAICGLLVPTAAGAEQLMVALVACQPVVLDWGFPVIFLPLVDALMKLGVSGWWFDGDRKSTNARYQRAKGSGPSSESLLLKQLGAISSVWPDIQAAFKGRTIDVLTQLGGDRTPEDIWAAMGGSA